MSAVEQNLQGISLAQLPKGSKLYFLGIAGTGMASIAGLCKEAGFDVCGSDQAVYQPTAGILAEAEIPVFTPYQQKNLETAQADLMVVGNAISRGHPELEYWIGAKRPFVSFPQLFGDYFLEQKTSVVIAGTHGKTTTTALTAHVLTQLGEEPGWLIGGLPQDQRRSFSLGKSSLFVSEGDEYNTAFFDKGAKFLHYRPRVLLLNNLEHDHVDMYPDFSAVLAMFGRLLEVTRGRGRIVAHTDSPGVQRLLSEYGMGDEILAFHAGTEPTSKTIVYGTSHYDAAAACWRGTIFTERWGVLEIETPLPGQHNMANIAGMLGCLSGLAEAGYVKGGWGKAELICAIASFPGVKKRSELLGSFRGCPVYLDFAHHPTAVATVLATFADRFPDRRLIVAFDPKNASSRRNIFVPQYAHAFKRAAVALIGACQQDLRIPEAERMNIDELARKIGPNARAFHDNQELLAWLRSDVDHDAVVIFLTCGDFSAIPRTLLD